MTVTCYRSSDASAPSLTGVAGSLVTVLDAILVNGYGSQPAAGWSIAYTGTNARVYTMASGGTGNSVYVNDNGPGAAGGQEARFAGFESPTGLGTGTGQFPTGAQMTAPSGANVIRKSTAATSTVRNWTCVADGHTINFFAETGDITSPLLAAFPFVFGDFFSYRASDPYCCQILGRSIENSAATSSDWFSAIGGAAVNEGLNQVAGLGHYVDRHWSGVGGSIQVGKLVDSTKMLFGGLGGQTTGATVAGGALAIGRSALIGAFPYPNGPDGALWMSPIWLNHSYAIRGYMKGLWAPLHDRPLNHGDAFTVSGGNLNGKSFLVQNIPAITSAATTDVGQVIIETSNTWG